jgi:hypothetical protein
MLFSKRARQTLPKILDDVAFLDQNDQDGIHIHDSFVFSKSITQGLTTFWDEDVCITVGSKGLIVTPNMPMNKSEKLLQEERMLWQSPQQECDTSVPSLEEHIGKAHQETWKRVLVNLARHFDLEEFPSIEVLPFTQTPVVVGIVSKLHLSQLIEFGKDAAVFDYKAFRRKSSVCLMVHVK